MEEFKKLQENLNRNEEKLNRNEEEIKRMGEEIKRLREEIIRAKINENNSILTKLLVTKIEDINKLNDENKRCIICLEDFKNDDKSIYLPCFHLYHEKCITDWINMKKAFCPFCRSLINNMI